eukprot:5731935-Pyramimonas_sp.AAC.1
MVGLADCSDRRCHSDDFPTAGIRVGPLSRGCARPQEGGSARRLKNYSTGGPAASVHAWALWT